MSRTTYIYDSPEVLRVDEALCLLVENSTKSHWKKMCDRQAVLIDDVVVKAKSTIRQGQTITVVEEDYENAQELVVIFEDDDTLLINKPHGVLSVPRNDYDTEPSIQSLSSSFVAKDTERGGIVHRLDRETSGLMLIAKNQKSFTFYKKQFQDRTINKTYRAIIEGIPKDNQCVIDMPIARDSRKPYSFKTSQTGKPATTEMVLIKDIGNGTSNVELHPITGRTHQIRVHLSAINHPVLGDAIYSSSKISLAAPRMMLHAYSLEFTLTNGKKVKQISKLPKSMQQ